MSIVKDYIGKVLGEGIILRGNKELPMQIKETRKGVIYWVVGEGNTRLGSLDHVLFFEDYYDLERGKSTGAAFMAKSSFLKVYKTLDVEGDMKTAKVIDQGTVDFTASLSQGHIYTGFNGFKTLKFEDNFKSILSFRSRLALAIASALTYKHIKRDITPLIALLFPLKELITQDSYRVVKKQR